VFDRVVDSVVVLLDIVDELVSLLVAGALGAALVLELWLLVSVLVPEVWAMDTPPAMAAATAKVVSAFRVAFIVILLGFVPRGHLAVGRKSPAGASWFSD
jgi:hypothetical protein